MDANAELNQTLLNAMFALNEAGDNLDEIYRIGLETAVSLLNADRGCIFERDDWNDSKWSVIREYQFDKKLAEKIISPLLSNAVSEDVVRNPSEIFKQYLENKLARPNSIFLFSINMLRWQKWIIYVELEKEYIPNETIIENTKKHSRQLGIYLQRVKIHRELQEYMQYLFSNFRSHLSFVHGYSLFLRENEDDPLSSQQQEHVETVLKQVNYLDDLLHPRILYYPVDRREFENIDSKTIQDEILKSYPQTSIKFPIKFSLKVDKFNFLSVLHAILEKPNKSQIKSSSELHDAKLTIECVYEDSSLIEEGVSKIEPYQINSVMMKKYDSPIQMIKSYINFMGGQFKISAEAGKGYTLTITFPIVTEDAHE